MLLCSVFFNKVFNSTHVLEFLIPFFNVILGSIVVSISACHVEDPGSIPGRGAFFFFCMESFLCCIERSQY